MKTLVSSPTASWSTLKWAIALASGALACGLAAGTAGMASTAGGAGVADDGPRITVLADGNDGNTWGSPVQYGNTWG
ncbi:hypothetical protein [Microbispora sp. H13382]|uniref:hypothetical protein n=1 Tax=Microbispora sp. H13382 TaxID=2729112 RepID=UPI00160472A9|nr:hypothetical protein [Microbispora sp. H13382]